jgi:hypothetical protein
MRGSRRITAADDFNRSDSIRQTENIPDIVRTPQAVKNNMNPELLNHSPLRQCLRR